MVAPAHVVVPAGRKTTVSPSATDGPETVTDAVTVARMEDGLTTTFGGEGGGSGVGEGGGPGGGGDGNGGDGGGGDGRGGIGSCAS